MKWGLSMYKPSRYNFIWPLGQEEGFLVYNSFSTAYSRTDKRGKALLSSKAFNTEDIDNIDKNTLSEFIKNGYLIEEDIDELKILRFSSYSYKYNKEVLSLTIAPTTACNFRCSYCYQEQEEGKHATMSREVLEGIYNYVQNSIKRLDEIYIIWFGGEPLLAKSIILELSERIERLALKYNCKVSFFMITNGYLFDQEFITEIKKYSFRGIQITLDGPPKIHNQRRKLKNGEDNCFEHILDNIRELIRNNIKVFIRVNLDQTNADGMEELLDILLQEGITEAVIYPAQVISYTEACKSAADSCVDTAQFSELEHEVQRMLIDKGLAKDLSGILPKRKTNYCCADQINSYLIDPQGDMYKCWNHIGTKETVGNIRSMRSSRGQKMRHASWINYSPFDYKECMECKHLPICMGGCPYMGMVINHGKPECLKTKYNLQKIIMSQYENRNRVKR